MNDPHTIAAPLILLALLIILNVLVLVTPGN